MDLIGQQIEHIVFGKGVVSALAEHTVTVCFQGDEKRFVYPDAFKNYLFLKDKATRSLIEKQIRDREIAEERMKQAERERQEKIRKSLNFKIIANSHAAFNVAEEELPQVISSCQISTGTYLSGYSKGLPRAAERIKPNSLCLLTTRAAGENESERKITGAFMAAEDFFGEDSNDGIIKGHQKHMIVLPQESRMLFWKYFKQGEPQRWGNTAFKYCAGNVMNRILADIAEQTNPQEKSAAMDFYLYFCAKNLLPPLINSEDEN